MAERRVRLDQPNLPRRGVRVNYDAEAFGRTTEKIARFLGTGRYLVGQSAFIAVWIGMNIIPETRFDKYPFGFLTLILSLQAAYAAPLILLAQNRQDDRDRLNMDEDRSQARRISADAEYLAREIAAVRIALGDVVTRDFMRSELNRLDRQDEEKAEGTKDSGKPKSGKRKAGRDETPKSEPVDQDSATSALQQPVPVPEAAGAARAERSGTGSSGAEASRAEGSGAGSSGTGSSGAGSSGQPQ